MTETAAARPLKPVPEPDADGKDGGGLGGRVLDIAGVAAGLVLAVILADILSGGKITAWFVKRRGGGCAEGDCGEADGQGESNDG